MTLSFGCDAPEHAAWGYFYFVRIVPHPFVRKKSPPPQGRREQNKERVSRLNWLARLFGRG